MTHVDPEAHHTTDLPSQFVETDETASNCGRCQLGQVNRNDVRGDTSTKSSQDTSSVEDSQTTVAVGTALQTRSQDESSRGNRQAVFPANPVAETICEDGTEEGTSNEERDHVFTDQVLCGF